MSYRKIADRAGVSVSTVSKAFSQSSEISEITKDKIYNAAKELGLFDKYYKVIYPRKVIAVICPELYSRYYAEFAETAQAVLRERNAVAVMSSTGFDLSVENSLIEYYTSYAKVSGIIIIAPINKNFKNYSIPIVAIGTNNNIDCISIDFEGAVSEALRLFKEKGHKKIAFIGEKLTVGKEKLFCRELGNLFPGFSPDYVVNAKSRFEDAGKEGMEYLLSLSEPPTAVLTGYDYIAIGAVEYIKKQGLSVPKDISVIGMDDIKDVASFDPPLTTIKTNMHEIVTVAADIIMKKAEHPTFKIIQKINVPSALIHRSSVADACESRLNQKIHS